MPHWQGRGGPASSRGPFRTGRALEPGMLRWWLGREVPEQPAGEIDADNKEAVLEELLRIGQQTLESQPFSRLVGARLVEFSEGEAVLEVPIKEELLQQNGFVHGGVVSYAADNALTFAGGSVLGPSVLTSEYKINYLKPARGGLLRARASVIQASKRQAVCRCEVFAVEDGRSEALCAVAQGTIVAVAGE